MNIPTILFVYDQLHPIHKRLMECIGADLISNKREIPQDYEIYIFEGSYIRPVILRRLGRLGRDKKIVSWISDPRLHYLDSNRYFDFKKEEIKETVIYSILKRGIMSYFLRDLDGAICVGDLNLESYRRHSHHSPRIKVPGFVSNNRLKKLRKIKPNLNSHNLMFIGHGEDHYCKGIDIMIDSFKIVKEKIKDSQLFIAGRWNIKERWKVEGVTFLGDVEDIENKIKRCSIGIHLGRGEAFGVNIPEMMIAGLPVLTSNLTGAKDLNMSYNLDFITRLDKEIISDILIEYFNSTKENKLKLSNLARKSAEKYSEDKIVRQFKKTSKEFLMEVRDGK